MKPISRLSYPLFIEEETAREGKWLAQVSEAITHEKLVLRLRSFNQSAGFLPPVLFFVKSLSPIIVCYWHPFKAIGILFQIHLFSAWDQIPRTSF